MKNWRFWTNTLLHFENGTRYDHNAGLQHHFHGHHSDLAPTVALTVIPVFLLSRLTTSETPSAKLSVQTATVLMVVVN